MSFLASVYRQLVSVDLDEIFSYQTTKEVRMLDVRLGIVCWLIRAVVLVYVIVFVFYYEKGFTEVEKSVGHVLSSVNGSTYSVSSGGSVIPWDAIDAVTPALENGAAFIATTIYVTKGQTISNFSNPLRPCAVDADCVKQAPLLYGECHSNQCWEHGWQPPFSEMDTTSTSVNELVGADQFGVWLRSSIQFTSLDAGRIFSTMDATRPRAYDAGHAEGAAETAASEYSTTIGEGGNGALMPPDFYTVGELLALAGTSYDTIKHSGCTLSVAFVWKCFVDDVRECAPQIKVARLDLDERRRGFSFQHAYYYRPTAAEAGGASTRDLHTVKGIRLLFSSLGEGRKTSLSAIMLQISSGIALLWLAGFAADFLMLHVLPERKHYRTYKQERTPDFSDLRHKIAEVEGEKKKLRDRKNRFAAKLDES